MSKIEKTTTIFTTINETKNAFDDVEKKRKQTTLVDDEIIESKKMKIIENENEIAKIARVQIRARTLFDWVVVVVDR